VRGCSEEPYGVGLLQSLVCVSRYRQGCQIGYFMANFKNFDHCLSGLAMKKRIWRLKIWPFFSLLLKNDIFIK